MVKRPDGPSLPLNSGERKRRNCLSVCGVPLRVLGLHQSAISICFNAGDKWIRGAAQSLAQQKQGACVPPRAFLSRGERFEETCGTTAAPNAQSPASVLSAPLPISLIDASSLGSRHHEVSVTDTSNMKGPIWSVMDPVKYGKLRWSESLIHPCVFCLLCSPTQLENSFYFSLHHQPHIGSLMERLNVWRTEFWYL